MRPRSGVLLLLATLAAAGCSPTRRPPLVPPPAAPASVSTPAPVSVSASLEGEVVPADAYEGAASILWIEDRALVYTAGLHIDVDGSPRAKRLDPLYGQTTTSLLLPDAGGTRRHLDAEAVPYIVLPRGFADRFGIGLGDVAAVSLRERTVFAVYGDVGPAEKLGEGSKLLAERLGHAPWRAWRGDETFSTHGGLVEPEVTYRVFPGSRPAGLSLETLDAEVERVGRALLIELEGAPAP